jgi:hypothetical protein
VPWNAEDWDGWIDSGRRARPVTHQAQVQRILRHLPDRERKTVGDLGRERAARLPLLESLFERVLLVDLDAPARDPLPRTAETGMARCTLRDLGRLRIRLDVTVAIDALAGSRLAEVDGALSLVHAALVEGGVLVATFPAVPRSNVPFTMRLDHGAGDGAATFHEVELQYRLQRAGFQGVRVLRLPPGAERRPSLLCMAVRRSWN